MSSQLKEVTEKYAGPMSAAQIESLRDMQGWIEYCISGGFTLRTALDVLSRDINAMLVDEAGSRPKVSGYAKYRAEVEDLSDMANDPNPNDDPDTE